MFSPWVDNHKQLAASPSHAWSSSATGYHWESGSLYSLGSIPAPLVSLATTTLTTMRHARLATALNPATVATVTASEAALLVARLVYQYHHALKNADQEAQHLAEVLISKRQRYRRLRCVAHSLGCYHLLLALSFLTPDQLPHEVHLLAPAFVEEDVAALLTRLVGETDTVPSGLKRSLTPPLKTLERMYVYHTPNDLVLGAAFKALHLGADAVGAVGLQRSWNHVESLDVSSHFDLMVHSEYKHRFATFAKPHTPNNYYSIVRPTG